MLLALTRCFSEAKVVQPTRIVMQPFHVHHNSVSLYMLPRKPVYAALKDYFYVRQTGGIIFQFSQARAEGYWENSKLKLIIDLDINQIPKLMAISDIRIKNKDIQMQIKRGNTSLSLNYKDGFIMHAKGPLTDLNDNSIQDLVQNQSSKQATGRIQMFTLQIAEEQLIAMRELAKFSYPYLMGWQVINSLKYSQFVQ